ncbi:MAG: hypothetical protein K2W82_09550 [Candidatus Obscuribacterales bacterium]|nr:hypothetical protein [Candidatus Obscuribacterales bacterium]
MVVDSTIFSFGTKSETLERLEGKLKEAVVLPQMRFTVAEWQGAQKQSVIKKIEEQGWFKVPLIVRSSASVEDTSSSSQAGRFLSLLDVKGKSEFENAVDRVFASYESTKPEEHVLIQPMVQNVKSAGVAFSFDPNTGSPYVVINYDTHSHSTASVTSGASGDLKTFYCFRHNNVADLGAPVASVLALVYELENVTGCENLDIEFAIDNSGQLYLLQCRQLVCSAGNQVSTDSLRPSLQRIEEKAIKLNKSHPYLLGTRTVFGVMPDWNPAEIIGTRPRSLALSLYQELVTDSIWAYQRDNYGYRNVRSFPLLVNFGGMPFIDVRVDFNSFVPADLAPELGERLVDYYINCLEENPNSHDKIEFDVVYTCFTFDLPERIKRLQSAGFSAEECETITDSLCRLTNKIIGEKEGLWQKDINKIRRLEVQYQKISTSNLDHLSKIYWLIEDCKRYGTLPFAGLARAGFIAVQMLKSLVNVNIINQNEYDQFMSSLDTVSSRMNRDFSELSRSQFLDKYGHLRPGTYDILSSRYDEEPERYFDWATQNAEQHKERAEFSLNLSQFRKIEELLQKYHLEYSVLGFLDFLKAAIEGREFAKFVFTKSLSDTLSLLKDLGKSCGFSVDDCSFINIQCIKQLYASSADVTTVLAENIRAGKEEYEKTKHLRLPPLIIKPTNVWNFEWPQSEPNYITQKSISGPVVFSTDDKSKLNGAILFIQNADPGYDWIFCHGIKGFVTMYGGVNSHMAIRSGELGIPAVIGAGELLYEQWAQASLLNIDCCNRQVIRLK